MSGSLHGKVNGWAAASRTATEFNAARAAKALLRSGPPPEAKHRAYQGFRWRCGRGSTDKSEIHRRTVGCRTCPVSGSLISLADLAPTLAVSGRLELVARGMKDLGRARRSYGCCLKAAAEQSEAKRVLFPKTFSRTDAFFARLGTHSPTPDRRPVTVFPARSETYLPSFDLSLDETGAKSKSHEMHTLRRLRVGLRGTYDASMGRAERLRLRRPWCAVWTV